MENFEELIKDYVVKTSLDTDPFPTYEIKRLPRRKYINLRSGSVRLFGGETPALETLPPGCYKKNPTPGVINKIMTPDGIFNSAQSIKFFYKMTWASVAYHLTHNTTREFYYYEPPKT